MKTKKILTKLKLINWHYFQNETICLKESNLFSGENGAGKSTILDAIQLVLTTNSRKFNLAANERSSRTLKSYVRGKTGEEDNEYLRKGAVISYVALEFYEQERNRSFVIGLKIDSPDLESDPKKKWFCEEGTLEQLTFIADNKPATDEQFRNDGKKVVFIQQTSVAKERFKHRLGHLQDNFFELLAKSIAFKPMNNVKGFVSQFILPEKTVDIQSLRENIHNLKEMQNIVEELKGQVSSLAEICNTYESFLKSEEQIRIIDILMKIVEKESEKYQITEQNKKIQMIEQSLLHNKQDCTVLESDIERMNERYISMQTALQTNENALLIHSIKSEIKDKQKDKAASFEKFSRLKEQLQRIKNALSAIRETFQIQDISCLEYSEISVEERNQLVIELKNTFSQAKNSLDEKLLQIRGELKQLETSLSVLSVEIRNLESNKITYDRNVSDLKNAVETEFSSRGITSPVYILADLLEISDTRWQNAVEGYLNTQRFYIIVEPAYYDIAAQVYDRNKARIHTAAIVNTAKLKTDLVPDKNTLACVVKSQNRYANAYISQLLGKVVMCSNVSELKQHTTAITPSCMLYHGNALRKINPEIYRMPYIGKYALQKQLELKKEEYRQQSENYSILKKQKESSERDINLITWCNFEVLEDAISSPVDMQKITAEIISLNSSLKEAENNPAYLQMQMEAEELEQKIRQKRNQLDSVKSEITRKKFESETAHNRIRQLDSEIQKIEQQISDMSREHESALKEAQRRFDEHQKNKTSENDFRNYQPQRTRYVNSRENALSLLIQQQTKYKNGDLGTGIAVINAYFEEYSSLTKHNLVSYEEKLRTIQENCETEFKESFLAKMRENIENARLLFKNLNKTLKPIYYGNDSYRFECVPEKNKKRLYEMIMSEFNLGGFTLFSSQFEEEYHDEMNELFSKLTVSDENGDDVLREYTDYRNYLDYDIEIISKDGKTQKFSKIYREKSGGETQTPYYVAIAASFAQLYSTGETVRIIMLDEAFDKMDEERIESMISFFKSQDFQIILAAPTSRLELIGEQIDNIIMVYSDSEHHSFTDPFSYGESI